MNLCRRDFLKLSAAGSLALFSGFIPATALAGHPAIRLRKRVGERITVCPYCGVGCNALAAESAGKIINLEGDPDCPINKGSLCPKAASLVQVASSGERITSVKYRAAGASEWADMTWDNAITEIAKKIQTTRDATFQEKDGSGKTINRTMAIASLGSVFPNTEEAYLMSKMLRALGLVYIENEARICVSAAVAADTETVGRGPMSNHWIDVANSDCILIIGGNFAESFPVAFKWATVAKQRGAKLIHVDPRFTRTSAKCDLYARVRPGSDIAFINGMIRYVVDDMEANPGNYNMEYVKEYTNAAYLVDPSFQGPADTETGLFSGWDGTKYGKTSWVWQKDGGGNILKDMTLTDPNCVFQLLKKHLARYTDDKVVDITGTDKSTFQKICQAYAATGKTGKAGSMVFSSCACQHSTGTQLVRGLGILQLLLGNMGVAGGGLNGITGAVNGLGCTLQGLINHWGPGADSVRPPNSAEPNLTDYGANKAQFASILKAWYRDTDPATAYHYFPKRDGDYSWQPLFKAMDDGTIEGLICWGSNPAVCGPNSEAVRSILRKLKWIVVIDLWETETATAWQLEDCDTEVFLLPAAHSLEKEGSVCNSGRWNQWRYKVVDPPGEAESDLWIIDKLMLKLKDLYARRTDKNAAAITAMTWDYEGEDGLDVAMVAREMNGYDLATGKLLSAPGVLKADGTTSCGNWLWCGMYTEDGNMMQKRNTVDDSSIGLYSNWGKAWPLNRRIMYNRASVDLSGLSWDLERPVISFGSFVGDVIDGTAKSIDDGGEYPFVMMAEKRGYLFGPGRVDGPFPEHYEPWESPVSNPMSSQQTNPAIKSWEDGDKGLAADYPIVGTTSRLTEHFHTGAVTRRMPWLLELQPGMFVEISKELAAARGISNGDTIVVESARGTVTATAMVTARLKPVQVAGTTVHYVSLPWNWGYKGLSIGDSANQLSPRVADPNTGIPEFRSFLCQVSKA